MREFYERARQVARAKAPARCTPWDFERLVEREVERLVDAYRATIGFVEPKGGALAHMRVDTLKVK